MLSSEGSEAAPLSASSKKASKEAVSTKAELDALCAVAELNGKKHNVAFAKIWAEGQDEVRARKETTLQNKVTL